jgi:hypothetical protein
MQCFPSAAPGLDREATIAEFYKRAVVRICIPRTRPVPQLVPSSGDHGW